MTAVDPLKLHTFDLEAEGLYERISEYVHRRTHHDRERLGPPESATNLHEALAGAISAGGLGSIRAFQLFTGVVDLECQAADHPQFLAFVPYAPAVSAVLFDMALSTSGVFGTSWFEAAGAIAAENQALAWLADLAGMAAGSGGTFVSGGTVANVNGLAVARHAWRATNGDSGRRVAFAASAEVHSSVRTAAQVLEIDLIDVPVDERGRLTGGALSRVLASTDAEVCGVAATAGITNLGVVDDLAGIARVCRDRNLWFHVDAAYGGAALVSPMTRHLFAGIEHADSLVIDPHKWLFTPLDCSALIYKDPELARATFTQVAAYLDIMHETAQMNPSDLAVHLSRRSRGLPFWFMLVAHGTEVLRAAVEAGLLLTREAADIVRHTPYLELAIEPELSVVVFRRCGWSTHRYKAWCAQKLEEGIALVLPTTWNGETLMRFCFLNPRTTVANVQALIDSMAIDPG